MSVCRFELALQEEDARACCDMDRKTGATPATLSESYVRKGRYNRTSSCLALSNDTLVMDTDELAKQTQLHNHLWKGQREGAVTEK